MNFRKAYRLMAFIIGFCLCAGMAERSFAQEQTVRIEGVVVGNYIGPEQAPPEQRLYFKLWQSGAKWIYQASSFSNIDAHLDGGTVSYDGTNLYHFAPESQGVRIPGNRPYHGMERIESNPRWNFAGGNGPLWWAYASSDVLQKDGPVPSFLLEFNRYPFFLQRGTITRTNRRVGPVNATIRAPVFQGLPDTVIAEIHPLATNVVDGIEFVTKCEMIMYGLTPAGLGGTNSSPKWMAVDKWEITLDRFGLETAPISFMPEIPVPTGTNPPVWITAPPAIFPIKQPLETNTTLLPRG
jgi:hypothetical protein